MNRQTALTGKKVYGQGSHAPTKGRVSAAGSQGYLKRSIRQQLGGVRRVGGDGKSDTRSGLAQAAMQRRQGGVQGGRPIVAQQGPRKPGTGPLGGRPVVGGGAASATAAQSNGSQVPQVSVNNNGQLELPYNPAWSAEVADSFQQSNSDLAALQVEQQNEGIEFNQANRQAGEDFTNQNRTTLSGNAGTGNLFSSAYGVQASNDANNHQNVINGLLQEHAGQEAGFNAERDAIVNGFKSVLQRGAIPYVEDVAKEAGTLGYGRSTAAKPKPHPRKPATPKPHGGGKKHPNRNQVRRGARRLLRRAK